MKHFYIFSVILTALLLCRPYNGKAQQQSSDAEIQDKIRAAEIAYLSQQLDLTPEEAQKFWPVYNKYTKEVETLIAERRNHATPKTDKQVTATTGNGPTAATAAPVRPDNELTYEQRMLDIRNHYNKEFQKVLPATKAGSVFRSEREFRGQLLRSLNERRARNIGGPGARRFRQ